MALLKVHTPFFAGHVPAQSPLASSLDNCITLALSCTFIPLTKHRNKQGKNKL